MNRYRGIFPSIFTMGNLFCGFASILVSVKGEKPTEAAWLIIIASFFDFLDGLVARISRSASRFGIELDSLADIVSFAVAPAVLLYSFKMINFGNISWILGFTFIMAGAYRLARYNLAAKLESKSNFIGLPLPAAAVTLASFVIFCYYFWGEMKLDRFLSIMIVLFSALMVSTIEYEAIPKFDLSTRKDRNKIFLLIVAGLALMIKTQLVMFPILAIYILSGIVKLIVGLLDRTVREELTRPRNLFKKKNKDDEV
ncbi:MAG: CDP-diacylglycerol--serine O-phosphatidyltransferase [candidate division Zixibacteria bacterium 4484_95]|nr:MAG: CDP-diacylglycerol--serine O-phosphatidyltransferase [candidate division Zixibacteria bacterium 4484_95]RKX20539.1 MAG: CDP-diacylglycerol--serine O-phosphatidyltransferase [candidate division Zixibacteria bacterium]